MKLRFIEYDLPLKEISHHSAIEKNDRFGHPSTLHIWWARKPLSASRSIIFSSLIDYPDNKYENDYLFNFIQKITPWRLFYEENNILLSEAKAIISKQWDQPPRILDPFAGGGSIPLEALKLGCEVYSSDYNPVAVFIEKATLEWPHKFGMGIETSKIKKQITLHGSHHKENILSYLVEKWSKIILKEVKNDIGSFYEIDPKDANAVGYLWAKTISCQNPNCSKKIPLVQDRWLAKFKVKRINENVAYELIADKTTGKIKYRIIRGKDITFDPSEGTISKGNAKCPFCEQITKSDKIRKLSLENKMNEQLIAVVYFKSNKRGKHYRIATEKDIALYKKSEEYLEKKIQNWNYLETPLPNELLATPDGNIVTKGIEPFWVHIQLVNYNLRSFKELFNKRQQLALITFIDKIKQKHEEILSDVNALKINLPNLNAVELANAIMGYLAIMVDRLAGYSTKLGYLNVTGGRGAINVFGRTTLPMMMWNYFESNVFNPRGASWYTAIERTKMALNKLVTNNENTGSIKCHKMSATNLDYPDNFFDAVITDPPYYDNIPYADLSDFYYVWLKRIVGDIYPKIFNTPLNPRIEECIQNDTLTRRMKLQDKRKNSIKDKDFFEEKLTDSFKEIYRTLKDNGIAVIIYAHRTTSGWETMLNSLINSGFVVTASWPIHTEKRGRLREISSATLASSIYMVCRKAKREEVGFYSEIQPKIKTSVEDKLNHFWSQGIVGGDFFISAIGPGMEIFSRYERVETYSGKKVTTKELLSYIRSVVTGFIINRLLKDASPTNIDKEAQFYLAYRWTYLNNRVEFDDARKLSSAMGVDLEKLWSGNGFVKKTSKYVQVLGPKERGDISDITNMVDVMHNAVLMWEKGETEKLKDFLSRTGYGQNEAFWQLCTAVAGSLLSKDKERQLLEGIQVGKERYTGKSLKKMGQKRLDEFGEEL